VVVFPLFSSDIPLVFFLLLFLFLFSLSLWFQRQFPHKSFSV
jgi:hypothetical protein